MDFGKIARKLEEGEYSTLEEFEVCSHSTSLSIYLIQDLEEKGTIM